MDERDTMVRTRDDPAPVYDGLKLHCLKLFWGWTLGLFVGERGLHGAHLDLWRLPN